ncbi:hypothetical protein D9M70_574160 [compost metagenome]
MDEFSSRLTARDVGAKDQDGQLEAFIQGSLTKGAAEILAPVLDEVSNKLGQVPGALVDRQVLGDGHAGKLATARCARGLSER